MSAEIPIKALVRKQQRRELQPGVQITKAGGYCRGRYVGKRNSVLGADVRQVLQRLKRLHKIQQTWPSEVVNNG